MKIFGFELTRVRQKAAGSDLITHIPGPSPWWPVIREPFTGAWQRGVTAQVGDALTHPTFWACVTRIAGDIAKIRPTLVEEVAGIDVEVARLSPYAPVLARPNHYQNRIEFFTYWMISKLTRGNSYALKQRDNRGIVTALYLLDPSRVQPQVTPRGDVYYACQQDVLAGMGEASIVVPAREIIHDKGFAPYHPLVGFSPVYAAGHPALQALTIMNNATKLFKAGSQTGGILTRPSAMTQEEQQKLEAWWMANYAGPENIGRIVVLGGDLRFEKPQAQSAVDSQLIEQLKWDDEKICATLGVPPFMVGVGPLPSYNNVEALGLMYYAQCLQLYFEALELCLTEGLELESVGYEVEFDIASLDRMDSVQKMDAATKGVVGGIYTPDEARAKFNLPPVPGGNKVFLQRQNWPLEQLGSDVPAPPPDPASLLPPAPPATPDAPPAKMLDGAALRRAVFTRLKAA